MLTISGMTLSTFDALRRVDGLELCSPRELRRIESVVDQLTVAPGVRLLTEGTVTGQAFVVVEGHLAVSVDGRELARLGPGELAGERAVIDGLPCTATVTAAETTRILVIGPSAFATMLADPGLEPAIVRAFDRRLCDETDSTNA
jgi:CRP-like cAMP-binding protein